MKPEPTIHNTFQDSLQSLLEPVRSKTTGTFEEIPVTFRKNWFYSPTGGQFTVDPEIILSDLHQFAESLV